MKRRTEAGTAPENGITAALAEFIAGYRFDSIPTLAVERAKGSFLDTLGIALAGSIEPAARIVVDYVRGGPPGPSSVLGHGFRTTTRGAALANGTMAHVIGFSDFSVRNVLHPSVTVLPAIWAVAEQAEVAGREVVTAHVIGVEISCKLGAVMTPDFSHRGFHPCAIIGAFGAAAASARLLGLNASRTANALGIAGIQASGIKVSLGSMSKAFAVGRAAENGVIAAELAHHGLTGPADVLEGRDGFFQTFGAGVNGAGLVDALGRPLEFFSPGITVKPYPSCTRSHPALEAALELRERYSVVPAEIEAVRCEVSPEVTKVVKISKPRNPMEAKFSMEFCIASALLDGSVAIDTFTEARLADPNVRSLMSKVRTVATAELAARAPFAARVTVRTSRGECYTAGRDRGPWEPGADNAALQRDQLLEKFRSCASRVLAPPKIEKVIEIIDNLEQEPSLHRLMDIVRQPAKGSRRLFHDERRARQADDDHGFRMM